MKRPTIDHGDACDGDRRDGGDGPAPKSGAAGTRAQLADGPRAWPPWSAPLALLTGLVLAAVGGAVVDIPALALGANLSESHVPPGLVIADTVVQDVGFVAAALFFAQLGGRRLAAWQFGLRPVRIGRAIGLMALAAVGMTAFLAVWALAVHSPKEKLLETLGTRQSTALLVASATLTCVVAPICEEFLFRGFFFSALRNWRGTWPAALITGLVFGGVHAFSAPVSDLVPLAALGFALCLVYRFSGSLYPCIALHSMNNSIAFASLEEWSAGDGLLLIIGALAVIALLALALVRSGVIGAPPQHAPSTGPLPQAPQRAPSLEELARGVRGPQPK